MKYKNPDKERGVAHTVLILPSDLKYARIGGMRNLSAAARDGLAPYIKVGKELIERTVKK
jgi:hypothetical protein